jgi:hypothetical protein
MAILHCSLTATLPYDYLPIKILNCFIICGRLLMMHFMIHVMLVFKIVSKNHKSVIENDSKIHKGKLRFVSVKINFNFFSKNIRISSLIRFL